MHTPPIHIRIPQGLVHLHSSVFHTKPKAAQTVCLASSTRTMGARTATVVHWLTLWWASGDEPERVRWGLRATASMLERAVILILSGQP